MNTNAAERKDAKDIIEGLGWPDDIPVERLVASIYDQAMRALLKVDDVHSSSRAVGDGQEPLRAHRDRMGPREVYRRTWAAKCALECLPT